MNKQKSYFLIALSVTIFVLALLLTGSSLLNYNLSKSGAIPLGTFITWIGLVALSLSVYWGVRSLRQPHNLMYRRLSLVLKVAIGLAVLWVPVSFALAGNISFNFSTKPGFQGGQEAMRIFWGYTYGIAIGALLPLVGHWIYLLFSKISKN
ncbi:hypothetical protein [Gilvibacter sp.]|uniref:hypothetical protein n=1 Tax=Gilvibacter sp. TaxID=2729997 RepID=UPI003B523644